MFNPQGAKAQLLGVGKGDGAYTFACQFPAIGATSIDFVSPAPVWEAIELCDAWIRENGLGRHPLTESDDELGLWFGAVAPAGCRAIEFDYRVDGSTYASRYVHHPGLGKWWWDPMPFVCDPVDREGLGIDEGAKRARVKPGDVVRRLSDGRYGTVISAFALDGEWLVALESTSEFPDGHPDDLASIKRADFCIATHEERWWYHERLNATANALRRRAIAAGAPLLVPPPGMRS